MRALRIYVVGALLALPPLTTLADGDAIAIVNGNPIPREQLVNLLLESHGLEGLQQLLLLRLARDEAARRNLVVSEADVRAELDRTMREIAIRAGLGPEPTREQQEQALQTILTEKRLSRTEFLLSIERNACLRKIIEPTFRVDDATLREEFARTYGERVIVRHIQIPAKDAGLLNEATARLARGEPFEEVARALSQNPDSAGRGGEMDPFTFDDATIPPLLREAAFSLKPGEVSSPLRTDAMCHILKLERRIEPEGVRLEDVRDKVETQLRERELTESFQRLMQELYERANVQVLDRRLKDDFEKARRQQAAAQRNP